jgi:hypothetical protein
MEWTPNYSVQKDGTKTCHCNMIQPPPSGVIFLSMVVRGFALGVSISIYGNCLGSMMLIGCSHC